MQAALLFATPGEGQQVVMQWSLIHFPASLRPPPLTHFSMYKESYTPGRPNLLQLSSCLDQCLKKSKCPSSGEAVAMVAGSCPVSPHHLRQVRGIRALRPRCDESSTRLKRRTWANTLLFTDMSFDPSHPLTGHPSCATHLSRFSDVSECAYWTNTICLITICAYIRPTGIIKPDNYCS